jgi:HAD superfamily hydrolase (TIGR01484 family)
MERPKLMVFDLDGTLAESKERVSAPMGELLGELLEKMSAAVMSGAAFEQFEEQLLPSFPDGTHFEKLYLFSDNGAQCFVWSNNAWHTKYDKSFNSFEKARIFQALKEALAETGLDKDTDRPQEWGERIEDRGAQITFSALGQHAPIEEKKKWDPTREKRRPLYEALVRRLPDFSVAMNATTSIDITQKGVNKAYGIRRLIEYSQTSVSEMLYVGDALEDGGNDSVVKETGIRTMEVFGPEETAELIKATLA